MFFKLLAYTLGCLASLLAVVFVGSIRARQMLLLGVSYALYLLWGPWFMAVLLFSSIGNYFLGTYLRRRATVGRLWLGIVFNLFLLGSFKYLPGLANTTTSLLHSFRHLILPLGISSEMFSMGDPYASRVMERRAAPTSTRPILRSGFGRFCLMALRSCHLTSVPNTM